MTDRINALKKAVLNCDHHIYRRYVPAQWGEEFQKMGLSPLERAVRRIERIFAMESPIILEGEKIVFTRTIDTRLPVSVDSPGIQETSSPIFSQDEWQDILSKHFIHYTGDVNNVCPCYENLLSTGTTAKKQSILENKTRFESAGNQQAAEYCDALVRVLNAIEGLALRYRDHAADIGNSDVVGVLSHVPFQPPRTFLEALQFLRILNFTLYLSYNHHSSLGRFDQYMFKYLRCDLEQGVIDENTALEYLEEFFISLNKDSDLYYGMQRGDNGQAVTLGGKNEDGSDTFNLLSQMCLEASLELMMIDPKLNIRVHENTDQSVLEYASRLTRVGLGFPQYSNDDIVIPALLNRGYEKEDAYNYAIAACWEYIIPGKGMEIVDIEAVNLPKVLDTCLREGIDTLQSYEELMSTIRAKLDKEFCRIKESVANIFVIPAPSLSLLMDQCAEKAKDISTGNRYNNYGVVATGISTAVDSLAAIKRMVFDEKRLSLKEMMEAVDADFIGYESLHAILRYDMPKFGNNDQYVDTIAMELLDLFADSLAEGRNERGGIFRPGTGSAMYYIWHPKELGASPDGRKKGEPFSANFSPSLNTRLKGPLSILRSFSKPDMIKIMNGGPVTLELSDTTLKGPDGIGKLAQLVRFFIQIGCQQMQLNAVNPKKLSDAMEHPEDYKNLIVRVWGWSGYFVQLDKEYQRQILQRCAFAL
jgi:pyruvate-formate lyase